MAISVEQLKMHFDAARAYIIAGNLSAALTQAVAAQAVLATLPDSKMGESEINWRSDVDNLIKNIRTLQNDSAVSTSRPHGGLSLGRIQWSKPGGHI